MQTSSDGRFLHNQGRRVPRDSTAWPARRRRLSADLMHAKSPGAVRGHCSLRRQSMQLIGLRRSEDRAAPSAAPPHPTPSSPSFPCAGASSVSRGVPSQQSDQHVILQWGKQTKCDVVISGGLAAVPSHRGLGAAGNEIIKGNGGKKKWFQAK